MRTLRSRLRLFGGGLACAGIAVIVSCVGDSVDSVVLPNSDGGPQPDGATGGDSSILTDSSNPIVDAGSDAPADANPENCIPSTGLSPGAIDSTFSGGNVNVGSFVAAAATIDKTDRVLVVGNDTCGEGGVAAAAVVRYNADGSLDKTFGTMGEACVPYFSTTTRPSKAFAIVADIDATGGIVVLGNGQITASPAPKPFMAKLTTTGSLDATFGTNGYVGVGLNGNQAGQFSAGGAYSGKVVVAGLADGTPLLGRYGSTGASDNSFVLTPSLTNVGQFTGAYVDTAGNIAATAISNDLTSVVLVRTDATGNGNAPIFAAGIGTSALNVVALPDASAVVGVVTPSGQSGVARFGANELDTTFGEGGIASTSLSSQPTYLAANVATQCDGKIVVVSGGSDAGPSGASPGGATTLTRFNANGTIDSTFGKSGVASSSTNLYAPTAVLTDSKGHLIVVSRWDTIPPSTSLMRFSQ